MIRFILLILTTLIFISACAPAPLPAAPTRDQIVTQFPRVEAGSTEPENKKVLCPFVRMMERAGIFDSNPTSVVPSGQLLDASFAFGCVDGFSCGTVIRNIAASQGVGGVDIEKLHMAGNISHQCGLTFELNGVEVSDVQRQSTLDRLQELADANGRLTYPDLMTVKLERCAEQGFDITSAGTLETKLIFAYLGGVDRGYITHSDVDRFLHATMPAYKTNQWITASLVGQVK